MGDLEAGIRQSLLEVVDEEVTIRRAGRKPEEAGESERAPDRAAEPRDRADLPGRGRAAGRTCWMGTGGAQRKNQRENHKEVRGGRKGKGNGHRGSTKGRGRRWGGCPPQRRE